MASASHNTFEGSDDEYFDQYFDQHFDKTFENFTIDYDNQEEARKTRKKKFISKGIVKKVI